MDVTAEFEDRKSFLHWFIIASLHGVNVEGTVTEVPRIVTMQINGVEVNPLAAIKRLEEQYDRQVLEEAQRLVREEKETLFDTFKEKLDEFVEQAEDRIKEKLRSKGADIHDHSRCGREE